MTKIDRQEIDSWAGWSLLSLYSLFLFFIAQLENIPLLGCSFFFFLIKNILSVVRLAFHPCSMTVAVLPTLGNQS